MKPSACRNLIAVRKVDRSEFDLDADQDFKRPSSKAVIN